MGIDIRIPIGALLAAIGALLVAIGLFGDPALKERSLGLNVNLWWGLVMLVAGVAFLLASRRRRR
jgi:hypothetical protein